MSKALTPEEQLEDLQRRFELLEGERKATYETAQQTIKQNKEIITQLKDENKSLRIQIGALKSEPPTGNDQQLEDKLNELTKLKAKVDLSTSENERKSKHLNDLTQQLRQLAALVNAPGGDVTLEGRQIRVLENRLDKAMVKLNEAQSIQKTYSAILKRLQDEKAGFDTSLHSVEKTLKSKQKDYEELLLLSHDAYHAKEMAQAELHRFEQGVLEERNQRDREVQDKKQLVQQRVEMNNRLEQRQKILRQQAELERAGELAVAGTAALSELAGNQSFDEAEAERQKLVDFEDAFKRLKEATGVSEVNEVIQKFMTQEETQNNLMNLTKEYQSKIDNQMAQVAKLKSQLDDLKFSASGNVGKRQIAEDLDSRLSEAHGKLERYRVKYEKTARLLIDVNAGVAHLAGKLNEVKLEGGDQVIDLNRDTVEEVLLQCESKMGRLVAAVGGKEVASAAYEKHLLERAQVDIRIRAKEGDEDGEDDADFDEEVWGRTQVKSNSAAIIEKQLKKQRAAAKKAKANK